MQKDDYQKLLNCPFCGHEAILRGKNGGNGVVYVVRCTYTPCLCTTPGSGSKEKVVKIWNRRYEERKRENER